MTIPLYREGATAANALTLGRLPSANLGLWYTRFYSAFERDWTVEDDGKRDWITQASAKPCGDTDQISHLTECQQKLSVALGGLTAELETTGAFVTGMGLSHPVENGFTFHPTLGTPYLPASGVKGLLRGWVEAWVEHANEEQKNAMVARWFGSAKGDDAGMAEGAGNLIIFDALPTKPVQLGCEIMTPHMGKWYEKGGAIEAQNYATTAPADWHSPVPVPFLVVKKGATFKFMIAPRLVGDAAVDAQTKADVVQAMKELRNALEWIGAGAKTGTGFGRMIDAAAERKEASAASLAAAGIKTGEVQWDKASVTWSKGTSTLTLVNPAMPPTDKTRIVSVSQEKGGKTWYDSLSEVARKRLDKGNKPVFVKATVSIQGNSVTLVCMEELP